MIVTAPVNQVKKTLLLSAVCALAIGVLLHVFVLYWVGQHPEQSKPLGQHINPLLESFLITLHYWISLGVFVFYGWMSLATYRLKQLKAEAYVLQGLYRPRTYLAVISMIEGVTAYWAQPEAVSTVFVPLAIVICLKFFFYDVFQSAEAS